MATEYKETQVPEGDARSDMLDHLAGGDPWVMIIAQNAPGTAIDLKVEVGGGIADTDTIRALLTKTLNALPS